MYDRVTIFPRGPWAANASLGALAYKTPKKKLIILYIWLISFISCTFIYFIRALIFIDPFNIFTHISACFSQAFILKHDFLSNWLSVYQLNKPNTIKKIWWKKGNFHFRKDDFFTAHGEDIIIKKCEMVSVLT